MFWRRGGSQVSSCSMLVMSKALNCVDSDSLMCLFGLEGQTAKGAFYDYPRVGGSWLRSRCGCEDESNESQRQGLSRSFTLPTRSSPLRASLPYIANPVKACFQDWLMKIFLQKMACKSMKFFSELMPDLRSSSSMITKLHQHSAISSSLDMRKRGSILSTSSQ